MAWLDKVIVMVSSLGKGLTTNRVTNLIDVSISKDSNNVLVFGTDNGLKVVGALQYKSIDGGHSNSVYGASQVIDGGSSGG